MNTEFSPIRLLILVLIASFAVACGSDTTSYDYYVDEASGDDMNPGTSSEPFATITQALSVAVSGEQIKVQAGVYDALGGEVFPLIVQAGVELVGSPSSQGANTLIDGGGVLIFFPGASITLFLLDDTSLSGFTIRNTVGDTTRTGVQINGAGVTVSDNAVRDITFGPMGGTGSGILSSAGFEFSLMGNELTGNDHGLFLSQGGADTVLEDNVFTENRIGVRVDSGFYYLDFGGGRLGSRGGNVFSCNVDYDLGISYGNTVAASDNEWDHVPPTIATTVGVDLRLFLGAGAPSQPAPDYDVSGATLASPRCP